MSLRGTAGFTACRGCGQLVMVALPHDALDGADCRAAVATRQERIAATLDEPWVDEARTALRATAHPPRSEWAQAQVDAEYPEPRPIVDERGTLKGARPQTGSLWHGAAQAARSMDKGAFAERYPGHAQDAIGAEPPYYGD